VSISTRQSKLSRLQRKPQISSLRLARNADTKTVTARIVIAKKTIRKNKKGGK
jgi:hypothetical protein